MRLAFVITGMGAVCVFSVVSSRATLGLHHAGRNTFANSQRSSSMRLIEAAELQDDPLDPAPVVVPLAEITRVSNNLPGAFGQEQEGGELEPLVTPADKWGHRLDVAPFPVRFAQTRLTSPPAGPPASPPASPPPPDNHPATFTPAPLMGGFVDVVETTPPPPPPEPPPPPVTPPPPPETPPPPPVVVAPLVVTTIVPPPPTLQPQASEPASPTPEPSSWATMILGLGAIGLALRRRRDAAGREPRAGHI